MHNSAKDIPSTIASLSWHGVPDMFKNLAENTAALHDWFSSEWQDEAKRHLLNASTVGPDEPGLLAVQDRNLRRHESSLCEQALP